MFPEGYKGSTAMSVTVPELKPWLIPAGPTAVQVLWDSGLVGSIVKMRKLTVAWSATTSPLTVGGLGFLRIKDQLFRVPSRDDWPAGASLAMTSRQVPT